MDMASLVNAARPEAAELARANAASGTLRWCDRPGGPRRVKAAYGVLGGGPVRTSGRWRTAAHRRRARILLGWSVTLSRFAVLAALGIALPGPRATAAEITVTPLRGTAIVTVTGTFTLDDGRKFADAIAGYDKGLVVLASDGGNILAALKIGTLIRTGNFATAVRENSECISACAIAWLGGAVRYMGSGAMVGFHAVYTVDDSGQPLENGVGNALVGAYLSRIGLPDPAIIYVTKSHPKEMTWLDPAQALLTGIDVDILPPGDEQAAEPENPPMFSSGKLETEVRSQQGQYIPRAAHVPPP
jgi:hypothetical protein